MDEWLLPLFLALPTRPGIDSEAVLSIYHFALEGESLEALESAVKRILSGRWYPEKITFLPSPPELADMVRREARRMKDRKQSRLEYIQEHIAKNNSWGSPIDQDRINREAPESLRRMLRGDE